MLYCDGLYVLYEGVPDDDVKYNKWSDRGPVNSDNSVFIYLFCHTCTMTFLRKHITNYNFIPRISWSMH